MHRLVWSLIQLCLQGPPGEPLSSAGPGCPKEGLSHGHDEKIIQKDLRLKPMPATAYVQGFFPPWIH